MALFKIDATAQALRPSRVHGRGSHRDDEFSRSRVSTLVRWRCVVWLAGVGPARRIAHNTARLPYPEPGPGLPWLDCVFGSLPLAHRAPTLDTAGTPPVQCLATIDPYLEAPPQRLNRNLTSAWGRQKGSRAITGGLMGGASAHASCGGLWAPGRGGLVHAVWGRGRGGCAVGRVFCHRLEVGQANRRWAGSCARRGLGSGSSSCQEGWPQREARICKPPLEFRV
jgi:hypothetical protein